MQAGIMIAFIFLHVLQESGRVLSTAAKSLIVLLFPEQSELSAEMLFMLDCIRMFAKGQGDMCTFIRSITPDLRALFHFVKRAQSLRALIMSWHSSSLQFRCRIKGTGAWEKMTFPLGRKLEHWDGANDGFAHFPLKTFNVNVPKPGEAVSGRVELCDFATTAGKTAAGGATSASAAPSAPSAAPKQAPAPKAGKPPKVEALAEAIDLKLFDGSAKWDFIKNTGKGSFELKDVEGVKAGAVNWDFSASKAKSVPYVLATVPVEIAGGQAITFQACSTVPQKLTFRVKDSTDQTLQFKTKIAPGAWSDVKFPLSKKLEHWDGANDGVVHFPVKSIAVSIPMPADATSGETLFSNFSVR